MPNDGSRNSRHGAAGSAAAPDEAAPDAEQHPDIASLLADFNRAQDEKLAAFESKHAVEHQKLRADFKADLAAFISPPDKGYRKRFARLEVEQADVRTEVCSLRAQMEQMSVRVDKFADTLQQAQAADPLVVAIDNDDFNRDPIPTIIRIRMQVAVASDALLTLFKVVLDEMRRGSGDFDCDAQPLGRAGALRFAGVTPIARLRVKDQGGRWRSFVVATPTEGIGGTFRRLRRPQSPGALGVTCPHRSCRPSAAP